MVGKIDAIAKNVESLNSDRKWVTRLIVGGVIMTLLGIIAIMMTKLTQKGTSANAEVPFCYCKLVRI